MDEDAYVRKVDYVVGASMLVPKIFLEEIGLMSDEYFLYFEELDWMLRARPNYRFALASRSIVYHKGGAATGATPITKSLIGEYYGTRSRILFTRKFYPYALPTVVLAILVSALTQTVRGRLKIAATILEAAQDGLRGRIGVRTKSWKSLGK
jgi:GT2 family glycosyltransferase